MIAAEKKNRHFFMAQLHRSKPSSFSVPSPSYPQFGWLYISLFFVGKINILRLKPPV
jgi:hypothetical protein